MGKHSQKNSHRTKTQHYVPQFYLRGFTNAAGRIVCYDKVSDKTHPTSTHAAAQESYFYEIPPGSIKDVNVPANMVENALSVVEKTWAPLHAALIKSADIDRITATLTIEYAPFLVMQWMRTKTYRDAMHQIAQMSMQLLADDLVMVNFPGESVTVKLGDHAMAAMHAQKLFDRQTVKRMADELGGDIWVVGINDTDHPFYTSDHPVVRRGNLMDGGRQMVGILDPGIEFAFPLDSRHILLILERTYFADWRKQDNRGVRLTVEKVRDYNVLQVLRSCQRVFCAVDDFELARQVCRDHPEVRDPARPRVRIETTPIVPAGVGEDGKKQWKNHMFVRALE
ncbi:MAG TPA: DUF4238 domain-containing protein [Gemmataceae bacterium]|nr:DUF4238 domain-containing protein [Gemmataceae bacterium]